MADRPITVFIADDHETMCEELCEMLSRESGFDVVGQCGDGRKAVEQVKLLRPDVALLDISLPGRNALDICRELTRSVNSTAILILAIQDRRRSVVRAFVYGALGYLSKTSAAGHLLEAIRTVARGELYLAPGILKTIRGRPLSDEDEFYKRFSLRARLVRQFIAEGKTTREIAGMLGRGPGPKSPVHAVRNPGNQGHLGGFADSGDSVPQESGKYPEVDEGRPLPEEDETNPPNERVREELTAAPLREPGDTVARRYADWPEAIEEINRLITDDVVVVDIDVPGQNGLDVCCELSQNIERKAVLILATRSDKNSVLRAFEYGASGYLLKRNAVRHLPEAIQTVARGEVYLGPDICRGSLHQICPGRYPLSDRLAEMRQVVEHLLTKEKASREITVFLADSLELYRQGVASLLDGIAGLKVVGQCGDGETALEQVKKLRPDVVVTDGMMPNMNGWDLCHELTRTTNDMAVLFLAIVDDEKFIAKAFECGASGCLQKRNAVEHLPEAIQTVARGELYLGPDTPKGVLGHIRPGRYPLSGQVAEMRKVVGQLYPEKKASREITVFLADGLELYRQGVASLLDGSDGLKVVGQCGDGVTALEQVKKLRPDVVVTDGMMPNMNGWDLCHELTRTTNDMAVLFLAIVDDEKFIAKAFEYGASGCLQKRNAVEHLPEAIQTVARGELYLGPDIPRTILGYLLSREEDRYKLLTPREKQVLPLLAEGKTIHEIADEFGVTPKTVKDHRRRLMRKLDIHDQASLVRYAARKGLVDP